MLPLALRALRSQSAAATSRSFVRYASTATTSNQVPANDPVKRDAKPNVSETNAVPTSSEGAFDKVLQESPEAAEKMRVAQAPNYKGIWSRSQNPREVAMSGPRFEQSIMEDQVRSLISAWKIRESLDLQRGQKVDDAETAFADIEPCSLAHMPLSSSSTSNPFVGRMTALCPVTEVVDLSDTLGSSST
jgi:hypothetical protein